MNKFIVIFGLLAISSAYQLVPCPAALPPACGAESQAVCVLYKDPSCPFNFCGKTFQNACFACYERNVYQFVETPCEELDSSIPLCSESARTDCSGSRSDIGSGSDSELSFRSDYSSASGSGSEVAGSETDDYSATVHELLGTTGGPVLHDDNIYFPHYHPHPQNTR